MQVLRVPVAFSCQSLLGPKTEALMLAGSFHSRFATLALLGLLPVATGGCGFLLVQGPPTGYERMTSFSCTEGDAGPILDVVWGALNVLGAIAASSNSTMYTNPGEIEAVGLGWGVVSGISAAAGFSKTSSCRAALRNLADRNAQAAPGGPLNGFGPVATPLVDVTVQTVLINPATDTLATDERVQLVATAHNSSGAVIPNKMFTWSSSNDAIASVNASGLVTAHAVGAVVIAARADFVVGIASVLIVSRR